jgi:hypothetical protein
VFKSGSGPEIKDEEITVFRSLIPKKLPIADIRLLIMQTNGPDIFGPFYF